MTYSIIGILAIVIMLIINRDVLALRPDADTSQTHHYYRRFLQGVMVYYITDALWGVLEENRLTALLYADTVVYFVAMIASVLLWTRYVVFYLEGTGTFGSVLYNAGKVFFALAMAVVVVNLFYPILFWLDDAGAYHAAPARYALLAVQILMFLLTSVYTLHLTSKTTGKMRRRYLTVGLFGIAMVVLIAVQVVYPLLPFYAMGYMLGTCLLHSFVVEDEKDEYREELEHAIEREREQSAELVESREALASALDAAEQANRAKTVFLNNMSHDIRTPMNAIVGFTDLAASHADNAEQVRDYLSKISVSSQHLLSLINDVLDMSRIESGKVTIEQTDVHLPDFIHDLSMIVQANISAKHQEMFIDTQGVEHEDIITDRLRLNQVLLNILSNAIKFTPEGGAISFRVIEKPQELPGKTEFEFRIKDTGIGMSEEFQKTIFEAFTREKTSTVSGIQGTGLGMAISKSIVDMMGGTITVNSKEGEGSEFIVNIPCEIGEWQTEQGMPPELEGLHVLVADDDENSRLSVCGMLEDLGMRAEGASCGTAAVAAAKEAMAQNDEFAYYIVDWQMPDIDGIETARRIRALAGDENPIIMLTAYDWTDAEKAGRQAGITEFCSKPIFASELRRLLLKAPDDASSASDENQQVDFSGKRILLAEDNEMNQMIALAILEGAGFDIDVANDGSEAVEMVKDAPADRYDIVLMDIQMPIMDGYEAAQRIRALDDEAKANIPIIAVTANAFEEDRRCALEAGMNGHLAKPYDVPAIMSTLTDFLS